MKKTASLLIVVSGFMVGDAQAEVLPKVGSCPVGYRTSGAYCIPIENTKEVVVKIKSCPVGYRTSGNYCIKLKK